MNDYKIGAEQLLQCNDRVFQNYKISEYYQTLYLITNEDIYTRKALSVAQCYKYFDVDYYTDQRIVDILKIQLCHDKFCKNCQNLLSKQRYMHFKPVLDNLIDDYDLYHVTLTVPNCSGFFLIDTLDKMYASFAKLIKVFRRNNSRHTYLKLCNCGYVGCVRSLEITVNNDYHPHFHCIFALSKNLNDEKVVVNKFSYNNGAFNRMFSEFEVTLQKLWYMIYNDIRITETNFIESPGYSVTADLTNYDYKEVFKYTLKESWDVVQSDELVFMTLRSALFRRRVIQGYGVLFGINFEDEEVDQRADILYRELIQDLWNIEEPKNMLLRWHEIQRSIENNDEITYISRNSVKGVINYEE